MVDLMNAMRLDVFVPGNWDFAYRSEQLHALTKKMQCPTTAVNVQTSARKETVFNPFVLKEFNGLKVGIVGLSYPYVQETMPASLMGA